MQMLWFFGYHSELYALGLCCVRRSDRLQSPPSACVLLGIHHIPDGLLGLELPRFLPIPSGSLPTEVPSCHNG
jgi:hypothetical protein